MMGLERLEGEVANLSCRIRELEHQNKDLLTEIAENSRLLRDIARSVRAAPAKRRSWLFGRVAVEA